MARQPKQPKAPVDHLARKEIDATLVKTIGIMHLCKPGEHPSTIADKVAQWLEPLSAEERANCRLVVMRGCYGSSTTFSIKCRRMETQKEYEARLAKVQKEMEEQRKKELAAAERKEKARQAELKKLQAKMKKDRLLFEQLKAKLEPANAE